MSNEQDTKQPPPQMEIPVLPQTGQGTQQDTVVVSTAEGSTPPPTMSLEESTAMLEGFRQKILRGEDPTPEEQRELLRRLRQSRISQGAYTASRKGTTRAKKEPVDLDKVFGDLGAKVVAKRAENQEDQT